MDYLLSIFVIFICLSNGLVILNRSKTTVYMKKYKCLHFGSSFFVGTLFLIVSIRVMAFISGNAFLGVCFFYLCSFMFLFFSRYYLINLVKNAISLKSLFLFMLSFLALFTILLLYWLQSSDVENAGAYIGSLHSVKYVNVAEYILKFNYIPILGQNTGQSIITYLALLMGAKSGFIVLTMFLVSSIIFLSMIVYDLFNLYLENKVLSFIATFIFFTTNTALSTSHILIIDSGYPFFMSGYSDTLSGVFIMIMFTIIYNNYSNLKKLSLIQYSFIILMIVAAFFVAPQNIILTTATLFLLFIFKFRVSYKYTIAVLILISSIISVPQGGMLTPTFFQDKVKIPGSFNMETLGKTGLRINPGLLFNIQHIDTYDPSDFDNRMYNIKSLLREPDIKNIKLALFYLEEGVFTAIRILFFPILGFGLLFLFSKKYEKKLSLGGAIFSVDVLKTFGLSVFLIGFIAFYVFDVNYLKWQMSRFIVPGVMFGLFSFLLLIFIILKQNGTKIYLKILALVIITSLGPLSNFMLIIHKRITEYNNPKTLIDRYEAFSNFNSEK